MSPKMAASAPALLIPSATGLESYFMTCGPFELFKIGVGPSSSHTVGPMLAARLFCEWLEASSILAETRSIMVEFYGSLALTGIGHRSDIAVISGLAGESPDQTSSLRMEETVRLAQAKKEIPLLGKQMVRFDPATDIRFRRKVKQPFHSNAMAFETFDANGAQIARRLYYSTGGGFVVDEEAAVRNCKDDPDQQLPYDYASAAELLEIGNRNDLTFADIVMANACLDSCADDIVTGLDKIAKEMSDSVDRGCHNAGILGGGLNVKRRAPELFDKLRATVTSSTSIEENDGKLAMMDWINLWAMAVNEENAAGGRVVTAPTNGAAGIVPAVIRYLEQAYNGSPEMVRTFLLTATAIGGLYKRNGSISGAEVGCQGEVGVACSMAAAGLTAALGGSNEQVENAAEIGMEHNLGLTCDPIGGLVQIPCIERNAMGAVKAIDASRIALLGDGSHTVSLDNVIATMLATGRDMRDKYKETSQGGLAVSVVEC